MQLYLKYKEYYDRKAKAAPLQEGDYCFILQQQADHQGSKIPLREFRSIGPYVIGKGLPNENYIVCKLNSNKTQILHRIRLRKYTPNTELHDVRPEGSLQADDEIIIPQDDLYIISWKTKFDEFPRHSETRNASDDSLMNSDQQDAIITDLDLRSTRHDPNTDVVAPEQHEHEINDTDHRSTRMQRDTNSNETEQLPEQPAENTADTDLWSTRPQQCTDSEDYETTPQSTPETRSYDFPNFFWGGDDTTVPDGFDKGDDDTVVESERPRGGKDNLRHNPNFIEEYRY